jgi:xanthine/CO dehydrogenase XdhC/CoxF family maturation factor
MTAFEHIIERGGSIEALRRVHTPVGIEINAVTAEEIAVSIVAELIRVRRGASLPLRHKSEALGEMFARLEKPPSRTSP